MDIALRLQSGVPVRIDGRSFIVGPIEEHGRVFTEKATGHQIRLPNAAQLRMARESRLTSEASFRAIEEERRLLLETDWGTFTAAERQIAEERRRFVAALDKVVERDRFKKAIIEGVIDQVAQTSVLSTGTPSARSVREWYRNWAIAGRDIRVLVPLNFKKGRRGLRRPKWMDDEINHAINEVYAVGTRGSEAETRRRATDRIRARSRREGLVVPDLGQKDIVGKNAISKALKRREQYDLLSRRYSREDADRILAAIGIGPQGDYPLAEVEIDHTPLDVQVVEDKTLLGRPWLSALIDRYSRCIIGFSLTFHPPSWTSTMLALQHAVMPKDNALQDMGGINETWDCQGVPDKLFTDGGKDFLSESMRATEAALNMTLVPLPRRRPQLKGKIERWFGKLEHQVIHTLPGTTFSNVVQRKGYKAEDEAILSLAEVNWVVTKWIVDIYHQEQHSATGEAPMDRWRRGISICGVKLPPPRELLAPLTGLVVPRTLNSQGIRFKDLYWNSKEFSALRNRLGRSVDVQVRLDPLALDVIHVFDPQTRKWIAGNLEGDDAKGLTYHQWLVIKKRADEISEPDEERRDAISRARRELFEFVDELVKSRKKSGASKRLGRFMMDGRKPSEHLAPERVDLDASELAIGNHVHGQGYPPQSQKALPRVAPLTAEEARAERTDQIGTINYVSDFHEVEGAKPHRLVVTTRRARI
ncbi:putative transposase [Bosea sp. OAE506]|uniref:Mu transposase C-terminal domain-containing protein n=1 Tax=Bosea sp. OAE506 TaxID=2663870 RepID=UPI001788FCAF